MTTDPDIIARYELPDGRAVAVPSVIVLQNFDMTSGRAKRGKKPIAVFEADTFTMENLQVLPLLPTNIITRRWPNLFVRRCSVLLLLKLYHLLLYSPQEEGWMNPTALVKQCRAVYCPYVTYHEHR